MRLAVAVLVAAVCLGQGDAAIYRQVRRWPGRCFPGNLCYPVMEDILAFWKTLEGQLLAPSDPRYANTTLNYNYRTTRHSALVVIAASVNDVQRAMVFARRHALMVTVKTGSSDSNGRAAFDGGLQIDLTRLRNVTVNTTSSALSTYGVVTAQSGATWEEVLQEVDTTNRILVVGNAPNEAIGGSVESGVLSPLARSLGLPGDNLVGAKVVLTDGRVADVTPTRTFIYEDHGVISEKYDRGLYYAIRGGGHVSVGVVVSMTFKLYVPPTQMVQISATWTLYSTRDNGTYEGRELLRYMLPRLAALPTVWGGEVSVVGLPDSSDPETTAVLKLDLIHYGEWFLPSRTAVDDILNSGLGRRLALDVRNRSSLVEVVGSVTRLTQGNFYTLNWLLGAQALQNQSQLDTLVDAMLTVTRPTSPQAFWSCFFEIMGGRIRDAPEWSNPLPKGFRSADLSLSCAQIWPFEDNHNGQYIYDALVFSKVLSQLSNTTLHSYQSEDLPGWKDATWGENYVTMLKVKRKWDPDNFLWCHNCVASDFRLGMGMHPRPPVRPDPKSLRQFLQPPCLHGKH